MFSIEVVEGKALYRDITVRDRNGALVDLTGLTLRFSVKKSYGDADPAFITKTSGSGITHAANQTTTGKGVATLLILPADTTTLELKDLVTYDAELEIIQVAGQPETIDTGTFTVKPAVRQSV